LGFTGSAGAADYNASASQIVIPAGSLTGAVAITATDDALDESNESVIVDITGLTNGTENGTQQVSTTIVDDDPAPTVALTIDSASIGENGGTATVSA